MFCYLCPGVVQLVILVPHCDREVDLRNPLLCSELGSNKDKGSRPKRYQQCCWENEGGHHSCGQYRSQNTPASPYDQETASQKHIGHKREEQHRTEGQEPKRSYIGLKEMGNISRIDDVQEREE